MPKHSLLYIIGLALLLAACGEKGADHKKDGKFPTMQVALGSTTLPQRYSAVVRGRQSVEVRPQVSGTITEIRITEGAAVQKGQVLFVIDPVPFQAALAQAEANLESAQARLSTARLTEESKTSLHAQGIISEYDLRTAQNARREAEAAVAQTQAAVRAARNNLSYTQVKSPVNGVASMIPYRVGALVSSSMAEPLVTVSDDDEVYAYFSLAERELLTLLDGHASTQEALAALPPVQFRMSNGEMLGESGTIDAISGTIDATTGAVSLRASFPNARHILRSGSAGEVLIPHAYKDVIIIPQAATYELQGKVFVYRVLNGKATSTPIEVTACGEGSQYIVHNGLKVGETIVAAGAGLVKEGAEIK